MIFYLSIKDVGSQVYCRKSDTSSSSRNKDRTPAEEIGILYTGLYVFENTKKSWNFIVY